MDIRNFFPTARKPDTTNKVETSSSKNNVRSSNSKAVLSSSKNSRKRVIESDSDEDRIRINDHNRKKKKQSDITTSRRKRIIVSSDESNDEDNYVVCDRAIPAARFQISDSSEDDVPIKKLGKLQNRKSPIKKTKQGNLTITSKSFKETTAEDIFGGDKVKRSNDKVRNIRDKLKTFAKPTKQDIKFEDDDVFETALLQVDQIGSDWVDWDKIKNSTISPETVIKNGAREEKTSLVDERTKSSLKPSILSKVAIVDRASSSGYGSCASQDLSDDTGVTFSSSNNSQSPVYTKNNELITVSKQLVKSETNDSLVKKFSRTTPEIEQAKERIVLQHNTVNEERESRTIINPVQLLWVEKYKPQSSKKIVGQQGDKSNVKKLTSWLNNWYKNNDGSKKATFVPNSWNKDPTGACFKAALLSGPPGVGKTTTVTLVCRELGFDMVEFNASDTRSKKLLQEEVTELLRSTSLSPFFSKHIFSSGKDGVSVTKKHVLVMDEVDGMAGNEDRGGIQELIQLIKMTKVPIICMCNDRNHPKIRSLVNYCFDLRFSRPRVEQIKGYMKGICFKEKLSISNETLSDIITSANNDIRLILNHLSMLAADKNSSNLEAAKKYIKLNAWDVLRKVFSSEDHKSMSIHDKCDLFFYDYNIAPLFVHENYLNIKPSNIKARSKYKKMELFARAADSISNGDCVDHCIRSHNAWSLLPTQAIFASYIPGDILEGHCGAQISFPIWLGKNSKRSRMDRLLQELQVHTRLKISASKESVNLDYAPHLKNRILSPFIKNGLEGVQDALNTLHEYDLLKGDVDNLQEICQWPNTKNTFALLDSKIKTAFTRAYNKNPPIRPYSLTAPIKKGLENVAMEIVDNEEENGDEKSDDDDTDCMIVTKKKQPVKKMVVDSPSSSNQKRKPTTSNANKRKHKK